MPVALRGKWQVATWRVVSGKLQVASDRRSVASADCLATVTVAAAAATKREVHPEEFPFCFHLELRLEPSLPHTLQREQRERHTDTTATGVAALQARHELATWRNMCKYCLSSVAATAWCHKPLQGHNAVTGCC